MSDRLTPLQFRTLDFIATCPRGQTMLVPRYWRDRTTLQAQADQTWREDAHRRRSVAGEGSK